MFVLYVVRTFNAHVCIRVSILTHETAILQRLTEECVGNAHATMIDADKIVKCSLLAHETAILRRLALDNLPLRVDENSES